MLVVSRSEDTIARPFFSLGHSTRPIEEFIDLLRTACVLMVVDVRTVPRSRTNPQYDGSALPAALAKVAIGYEHIPALGGLRGKAHMVAPDVNAFWKNQSFHNYADYAMTAAFAAGFGRLRELGHGVPCAIVCAETLWWRCHRRIIADYLVAAGETVFHILGKTSIVAARMTPAAIVQCDGTLIYPASHAIGC